MKKAFKGWYEMTNQNGVVLKAGRLRGDAMDIQGASDLFHNRMHELMRKFNDYQGWQKDEDVDDYRITKIFEVE